MKNNLPNSFMRSFWLASILFLISNSFILYAQTKTISGNVTSKDGSLPGVTIIVEGTTTGTITDFDGNFTIEASPDDTIVFNYISYTTKKVVVGNQTELSVYLEEDISALDEVVVVGYGTLEKEKVTGSISQLKTEDIEKQQAVSFEEALQGKAAGVQIQTSQGGPGEAVKVKIRGNTSINASNDPLYVIDGVEIDGGVRTLGGGGDIGLQNSSPLATLDPANIESINILKDANATAIYGARGANGVVIIKTKSGRNQKAVLELDVSTGIQRAVRHIDLLGVQEYVDFYNEFYPWDPSNETTRFFQTAFRDNAGNDIPLDAIGPDGNPRFVVRDWRDEVFRDALIQKYRLSTRGGDDKTWYSGQLSYTDQEGVIKNSDFKRIQGNINLNSKINDKLSVGLQVNGAQNNRDGLVSAPAEGGGPGVQSGVISNLARSAPIQGRTDNARIRQQPGQIIRDETGFVIQNGVRAIINPVTQINESVRNSTEWFGYLSTFLEYKILNGLSFKSTFSANTYINRNESYYPSTFGWGLSVGGRAFVSTFQSSTWQNNNLLTLNKTFGNHRITSVIGTNTLRTQGKQLNAGGTGFEDDSVNLDNLGAAQVPLPPTTSATNSGLFGVLARFNYDYAGRYVIDFTGRRDGSSRLFPTNSTRYQDTYSIGGAWNVSNEPFLQSAKWLNNFKLKASWGQVGNQNIPPFQSTGQFGTFRPIQNRGNNGFVSSGGVRGGIKQNGFVIIRTDNPSLSWETTEQIDFGTDIGLFNDRISTTIDVFRKNTTDLLLEQPVASQSGFDFVLRNAGEIQNQGLEIAVNTVNIRTDNFSWSTNFNISWIENKVIDLGRLDFIEFTAPVGSFVRQDYIVQEGSPLGSMYGYESDGVYRYEDFVEFDGLSNAEAEALYRAGSVENLENGQLARFGGDTNDSNFTPKDGVPTIPGIRLRPGMQKFKDLNNDGEVTINGDRKIIGDANPQHFGGITNTFKYKTFDFSFLMSWNYGNDIYNKNLIRGLNGLNAFGNRYGQIRDRWTPNNLDTDQHSLRGRPFESGIINNSSYIEDGSFLRLANISFGYEFPSRAIESFGLSSLRVYGALDNVYVWTNYSGYDPDVSVGWGQNQSLTQGTDYDAYPRARTFRIGVKANF